MTGPNWLDHHDEVIRHYQEWQFEVWAMVRAVLGGRVGWRFEVDDHGAPRWCFGVDGAACLVVTVQYEYILDVRRR
jgi:hypothetical protein